MFYGVEQSTDMRARRTVIKRFGSKAALTKWMARGGGFTHDDPATARNYHHNARTGYFLSGRVDRKNAIFKARGTPTYPRSEADNMATYLYMLGESI